MEKTKDISVLNSFKKIFSTRDFGREAAERYLERVSGRNSGTLHTMTKEILIDKVVSACGTTKRESKKVVESILGSITDCLAKGDTVRIERFGTFGIRKRTTRMARNSRTGEKIQVEAINTPYFETSKELIEKIK